MSNEVTALKREIRALRTAIEELTQTLRVQHLIDNPGVPRDVQGFPIKGDNFTVKAAARFPVVENPDETIDTSDIPEQGADFFKRARRVEPQKRPPVAKSDAPAMVGPEIDKAPPAPAQRRTPLKKICPECRRELGTNISCITCAPPR